MWEGACSRMLLGLTESRPRVCRSRMVAPTVGEANVEVIHLNRKIVKNHRISEIDYQQRIRHLISHESEGFPKWPPPASGRNSKA